MSSNFKYSLDEYVIFQNKSHQVISRLRFDHSSKLNANYKPGKKYYLLSMVGAPVEEEQIMKFDINEGC